MNASVIVLNWNNKEFLDRCFTSLKNLDFDKEEYEVIMADNGSTDGSVEFVKKKFPFVKIVENGDNIGFASGNNQGAKIAKGKYIIFLNPDTEVDKNWLKELVRVADSDPKIAICTSKQILPDRKTILYAGGAINFIGLSFSEGMLEKDNNESDIRETAFASGASFLIKRDVAKQIGLFDDDYFIYHEDVDLSWRAMLKGFKVVYVPTSVMCHYYDPLRKRKYEKIYLLERNRFSTLFKNYSSPTLFLISPLLFFLDAAILVYSIGAGWAKFKIQSYDYLLKNYMEILNKRTKIQKTRKVGDSEILKKFTPEIKFALGSPLINKVVSKFLKIYWLLVKFMY